MFSHYGTSSWEFRPILETRLWHHIMLELTIHREVVQSPFTFTGMTTKSNWTFFFLQGWLFHLPLSTTIIFATWLEGIICTLPVPNSHCGMRIDCRSTKLGVLRPFGLYRQKLRQQDGDLIRVLWRVYTWQPFLDQENYVDFSTTTTPPVKASNFPCQDWMIQGSADPASHCLPNMVGLRMFPFETSATSTQILLSTCKLQERQ